MKLEESQQALLAERRRRAQQVREGKVVAETSQQQVE